MLISVVIPAYNIEKYIGECIDSVLRQDHKELEIILVDDGSTDSSGEICDRYAALDDRIKVFHTVNGGLSAARNFGTEHATGEFLYYLDGDDMFTDGALSSSAAKISGDVDAVLAKFATFDTDAGIDTAVPEPFTFKDEYVQGKNGEEGYISLLENIDRPMWSACRPLFRRSLMIDNGIRFRIGQLNEDFDMVPHLYRKARALAVNDRANILYRINRNGSIMTTVSPPRFIGMFQIISRWLDFIENDPTCSDSFRRAMRRQMELSFFSYFKKFKQLNAKDRKIVSKEAKKLAFLLDSPYIQPKYRMAYRLFGFDILNLIMRMTQK